jgi:5-methylcytosine-specific restriction protein A
MPKKKRNEFDAKTRAAALDRVTDKDGNARCQHCKGILKQKHFDHHLPAELGGPATLENCQVLCVPCHKIKSAKDITMIRKADRQRHNDRGTAKPTENPIPQRVTPAFRKADRPKATASPDKFANLPRRNLYGG